MNKAGVGFNTGKVSGALQGVREMPVPELARRLNPSVEDTMPPPVGSRGRTRPVYSAGTGRDKRPYVPL